MMIWFSAEKITVREGREGVLTCSPGNVLNITFAKYEGRPRFCSRHEVTSIVQRQCQMKQTCTVYAEDKYYVDSCLVASEVLTIRYYCIGMRLILCYFYIICWFTFVSSSFAWDIVSLFPVMFILMKLVFIIWISSCINPHWYLQTLIIILVTLPIMLYLSDCRTVVVHFLYLLPKQNKSIAWT